MRLSITLATLAGLLCCHAGIISPSARAQYAGQSYGQIPVPGTGTKIDYVGDDFEEEDWGFVHNMPKSSHELNERSYGPMAYSVNRRWSEGPERGQPDLLKVVPAQVSTLTMSSRTT